MKDKIIRNEERVSKHINIIGHYADDVLLDKNNRLIKIIKIAGLDSTTNDDQTLAIYKNRRNALLKSLSSEFALYFWEIRKKTVNFPDGEFTDQFSKDLNDKYRTILNNRELFHKEHYLAIVTKQPEGIFNKSFNIIEQVSQFFDKSSKELYLKKRLKELNDVTTRMISALVDYQCDVLGIYQKNQINFSAPLEFLSQVVNAESFPVPLNFDIPSTLARKRLFFNRRAGIIETHAVDDKKQFAAVLSIKAYQPFTDQGIFDELGLLKIEYVMTQSYRPFDRYVAKATLKDKQKDMLQSKEESITQSEQIDEAFDDAASGDVGYGWHHLTLVCYADNLETLNNHVGTIVSRFADLDISCVREDIACECGFWAQLPGNFSYILRHAIISTKNMAAFASLHNYAMGKPFGNHWGNAVTVFETLSGSPYFFNFHYKDVGNFQVYGAMGSGKTVLIGFLIAQSMKFGGKRIIFDKDRGLEILVRAMGGVYERIKPGLPTGFNPCHLSDTPENRKFLAILFKQMLTNPGTHLNEREVAIIEEAIAGLYRLDKSARQFCHLASFFGSKKTASLRARFDQWHSDGAHAWLFDNAEDTLNLSPSVLGFDLGHILADQDCKTPALMYLSYRVEQAIANQRGMLFCDEGWKMLGDDYFKEMINDWSRTPRKKNNIFGLATQGVNDTVHSSLNKSINESAFCKIFFPNPLADRKIYVEDLGLSEHEYHLIKTQADDQHYFLLNFGRGHNKESVLLSANLAGLEDEIAIISAREETLCLLDEIRAEVGGDPAIFLPIFHARRKGL